MTARALVAAGQPPLPQELTADQIIGERIHAQMFRSRVTQTALARALGLQQSSISRRLRGERAWLASEVVAIARVLGVDYAELLPRPGEATEPTPPAPDSGAASAPTTEATMRRYTARDELTTRRLRRSPTRQPPAHAPAARVAS